MLAHHLALVGRHGFVGPGQPADRGERRQRRVRGRGPHTRTEGGGEPRPGPLHRPRLEHLQTDAWEQPPDPGPQRGDGSRRDQRGDHVTVASEATGPQVRRHAGPVGSDALQRAARQELVDHDACGHDDVNGPAGQPAGPVTDRQEEQVGGHGAGGAGRRAPR